MNTMNKTVYNAIMSHELKSRIFNLIINCNSKKELNILAQTAIFDYCSKNNIYGDDYKSIKNRIMNNLINSKVLN